MQHFGFIAEFFVAGGILSAIIIALDVRMRPQPMRIMNSVWILTGLWASYFGLWAYFGFGRAGRTPGGETTQDRPDMKSTERMVPGTGPERPAPGTDRSRTAGTESNRTEKTRPAREMTIPEMKMAEPESRRETEMPGMSMAGMEMPRTDAAEPESRPETEMPGMNMAGMKMPRTDAEEAESRPRTEMPGMDMSGMEMPRTGAAKPESRPRTEMSGMDMAGMDMSPKPRWQSVVLSTLHCGAGCTLADIIGEWLLYFIPVSIAGSLIAGTWTVDYLLALVFGIGFQYAAIHGMEPRVPRGEAVVRAAKADFFSLTAWQAGMYGWMAVAIFAIGNGTPLPRTSFGFWFMMQIAMACGFLIALPVNVLLIRYGIKKGM